MNRPDAMSPEDQTAGHSEWAARLLRRAGLDQLIQVLHAEGYTVVGPTIDQGAIIYSEVQSPEDLPVGWTEVQEPGHYRLQQRADDAVFGYTVGPHSWKKYVFPPSTIVAASDRTADGWTMTTPEPDSQRFAFLGVRACELAALKIQDRVFLGGQWIDPTYQRRRTAAFVVAVNCSQAASTCFCTSMNTGPRCRSGFDLALTEIGDGFVVECGSEAGASLLRKLDTEVASETALKKAREISARTAQQVSKTLNTDGIRDLLMDNLRHPQWDDVATRCLSCTNCTMVCPTCFCASVNDVSDLTGDHVERQRTWDSCFNIDFSVMNGGAVRNSVASRYRQWLTHKLSSWHDQFGTSGCVGCGRCITWCPVGIDLTKEVDAIRNSDGARATQVIADQAIPEDSGDTQ